MVPDVTGTEQHTGQMFVVDACSKNRICMATKRNIKHEGASKWPIYIQITVSLRLCRALLSTNGLWKAQTARRPGKCTAAAAGGNQGRVANREWEKTGAKNPKKSDSCELRKQMAVEDLI